MKSTKKQQPSKGKKTVAGGKKAASTSTKKDNNNNATTVTNNIQKLGGIDPFNTLVSVLFDANDINKYRSTIVPNYIERHERSTNDPYPFASINDGAPVPEKPIIGLVNLSISATKKFTLPLAPSGVGNEKVPVDPWHISGITNLIMASHGYGTTPSELNRFLIDNDILPRYSGTGNDRRHEKFRNFLIKGPSFLTGGDVINVDGMLADDPVTQFINTKFYVPLVKYLEKAINELGEGSKLKKDCLESKYYCLMLCLCYQQYILLYRFSNTIIRTLFIIYY